MSKGLGVMRNIPQGKKEEEAWGVWWNYVSAYVNQYTTGDTQMVLYQQRKSSKAELVVTEEGSNSVPTSAGTGFWALCRALLWDSRGKHVPPAEWPWGQTRKMSVSKKVLMSADLLLQRRSTATRFLPPRSFCTSNNPRAGPACPLWALSHARCPLSPCYQAIMGK